MNILVIHEVDWIKKVIFEPHHLAELFSLRNNRVYVIDCPESNVRNCIKGLQTSVIKNYNRVYNEASLTIIHPPSLLIKGLNRATEYFTCEKIIEKTVKEKKIDVILLYGVATNGIQTMKIARKNNIPVVFRVLDIAHALVRIPILQQITRNYERFIITYATKVLTTTPDLSRYAIEMGAKRENVEIFPLGINLNDFRPLPRDTKLAESLGISENDKVIVFMGTIYEFAGIDHIIQKFDSLKNKVGNVKFLILGGGPHFEKIHSLIIKKKQEKNIILTGFLPQKELPKYIALANLCVNPFRINYITERILPTKILEYMACEKAVLSTPLRGTKELLPNENFGIIYSDFDNFVEKASELLMDENKSRELGYRGYQFVKKNHDWDRLSEGLFHKFETILQEKKRS